MPDWLITTFPEVTAPRLGMAAAVVGVSLMVAMWARMRIKQRARAAAERAEAAKMEVSTPALDPARWIPITIIVFGFLLAAELSNMAPVAEALAVIQQVLNFEMFKVADLAVTPMSVITFLITLGIGIQLSRWTQQGVARTLRARDNADEGVIAALQRLAHYGVIALTLAIALQAAGFSLSALVAASTVFAVGLGFGLQTIVTNFVSGILLLMERSIKPGDILTVDGKLVRVTEMGIRATIGVTLDDDEIIIPNSILIENAVINHSFRADAVRARAQVGVSYDSDMALVQRTLEKTAKTFPRRLTDKPVVVQLTGFGASSVDFDVSVWVSDAFVRSGILSDLRHAIWNALAKEGIVIAYPQLDVHFDPEISAAVTRRATPEPPTT